MPRSISTFTSATLMVSAYALSPSRDVRINAHCGQDTSSGMATASLSRHRTSSSASRATVRLPSFVPPSPTLRATTRLVTSTLANVLATTTASFLIVGPLGLSCDTRANSLARLRCFARCLTWERVHPLERISNYLIHKPPARRQPSISIPRSLGYVG